ncbi:DNA topoisomerase III [Alteribacillus iranensis]|uniref:DNA topoisomerase 3 n=1 Tax=Alteribacillus iranensis TaxID=930128 RepID=A0A1I2FDQ0_9BACI|nr:DNA topoisomerase III [Alteribacillus iranensis]SFF02631.1 DNA topoisomerase-3 [Alteribacillus iranensis]
MNKSLILAEKPSVGKDIAKVMNCRKQGNGFLEGDKYIVTWAFGHLVTLAEPEAYEARYKTWRLEDLPMLPSPLKLSVINKTGKQFRTVKAQLNRKDVSDVVIATDAGREGELVARWILEKAKVKKPIKRLWISSVTDQAIRKGFQQLQEGRRFDSLYEAAQARSEADWYVGMNATRALTVKHNASLSCGRVQTPTLAMVHEREEEIKSFQPASYKKVFVTLGNGLHAWYQDKRGNNRIFSGVDADKILENVKSEKAVVTKVKRKKKVEPTPLLYDLTEIQREANNKFGFSAKETLNTLQKLYENHKVLTYPRTDSRYLSSDLIDTIPERLKSCDVKPFSKNVLKIKKEKWSMARTLFNDQKVSDHHALIPTEVAPVFSNMSDREKKIYNLVVQRFIASFYPAAEYEITDIETKVKEYDFVCKEKQLTKLGWKEIYERSPNEKLGGALPQVEEGAALSIKQSGTEHGETQPPSSFTEASLLAAMVNPERFIKEKNKKDLAKTLKSSGGIGTVATRADIIEKLLNHSMIEKKGKYLHTTLKGRQLLTLAPEELVSPALTAEWEQKLLEIERGNIHKASFLKEIKQYTQDAVQSIKQSKQSFKHDNVTGTPCPHCGKLLLEVKGKNGKRKVCQDRSCGYIKNISKTTNARCPQCKKRMELRGEGEGQIFVCRCGHKEKVTTFNERRKREKQNKASKRDVNKYLKSQDKEEMKNPALAEALAKLKGKD